MGRKLTVVALILLALFLFISRKAWAAQEKYGCGPATEFTKVSEIYLLTTPTTEAREIDRQMKDVQIRACRGDFGRTDAITFANGRMATPAAGDITATWTWPNGTTLTPHATAENASVYYPNGNVMSSAFRRSGATFNYPDGRTMATSAGVSGRGVNDLKWQYIRGGVP